MSYSAKKDQLRSWIYLSITVFTSLPITGVFYSFGIFVDIYLELYDGETNSKAGWIGSILLFCQGICSLIGVYLLRNFGLQRVMFVSTILVVFSFVLTPHMPRLELLFLTYSVSFGAVCGFYECATVLSLREFFDRYLGLATGIRYAGVSVGPMIFSYLIPIIFDAAGWNTMMTCFSGIGVMIVIYTISYKYLSSSEDTGSPEIALVPIKENKIKIFLTQATKSLLKDKRVLMVLAANALFSVVEYVPNMFMIQNTKSLGYSISKSKWILVAFSSVSILSRSVMGFVVDYIRKLNILRILLSVVLILFGIFSVLCSFTQSLTLMMIYMSGIGVLDGMYWVMLSLVAMELSHGHSDIMFTLILFANAFGYLIGPPAMGNYLILEEILVGNLKM